MAVWEEELSQWGRPPPRGGMDILFFPGNWSDERQNKNIGMQNNFQREQLGNRLY